MSRRLERALDACLVSIREGSASLDECLARYPDHAAELRPLLELATSLERVPVPEPDPSRAAAGRGAMLAALARQKRAGAQRRAGLRTRPARGGFRRVAAVGLAALILIMVGGLVAEFVVPPGIARAATLQAVRGGVQVQYPGVDVWDQAEAGVRLPTGSRVRTGPNGTASIELARGSVVVLGSGTQVEITDLRSRPSGRDPIAHLRQESGSTVTTIPRGASGGVRLEIETPHARIRADAGSGPVDVAVDIGEGGTDVAVAAGRVTLEGAGSVAELGAGEAARVQADGASATPTPRPTATGGPGRDGEEGEEPGTPDRGSDRDAGGGPGDKDKQSDGDSAGEGTGVPEGTPEPHFGDGPGDEAGATPGGEGPCDGTPQGEAPGGPEEPEPSGPGPGEDDSGECEGTCGPGPGSGAGGGRSDDGDKPAGSDRGGAGKAS